MMSDRSVHEMSESGKSGKRVAVVLARNFEDVEATSPIEALEAAGAEITG